MKYLRKSMIGINTGQTEDSIALDESLALFENIYMQQMEQSESNYDEINILLSDVFTKFNQQKDNAKLTKLITSVLNIYSKANSFKSPVTLKLWDEIAAPVYDSWQIVNLTQWEIRNAIISLNKELYINQKIKKEAVTDYDDNTSEELVVYNCKDLPYYACELFWAMQKNKEKEYDASAKNKLLGDMLLLLLQHWMQKPALNSMNRL